MKRILITVKCAAFALFASNLCGGTERVEPVDLVYPHLDTNHSRWFYFSSACRPFGLVNLSPDTEVDGAWGSGYRYKVENVKGFSHVHAWQLSGLSVMPISGQDDLGPILENHSSNFSHETEIVKPGYHFLSLDRYGIDVELTSSKRAGFHRYRFGSGNRPGVLFDLMGKLGPSEMIEGKIEQIGPRTLRGSVVNAPTIRRPKPATVFFHVAFDSDVSEATIVRSPDGYVEKALFLFADKDLESAQMKVGLSYTSEEGARRNLEAEVDHWDFDQLVSESRDEWNRLLGRIEVEGNTLEQRRRFYTDLWHALQGRRLISDIDGSYPDNTGDSFRIGKIPLGNDGTPLFGHYNSDSFWGAQWTLNTLWHLVYPEITEEFVNSLLLYYKDGGLMPRGPSGGNYTYVMTGASATPFVVSAWMKGIRGFDAKLAYEAMLKNHSPGGIMGKAGYEHDTQFGGGFSYYLENGYVPYPIPEGDFGFHQDGASLTHEYAYQDWTLAQLARELGFYSDAEALLERSKNYRNAFDRESGWMRPKSVDGVWREPFDPYQWEHGFNESNGAQHLWFVPHDPEGLAELLGGKEIAIERLGQQFEQAKKLGFTAGTSHAREKDPEWRRVPINYGNQPSIQTAFIFAELGRPDLSHFWSRQVVDRVYGGLNPGTGYNGDEDQGLMGTLAVLMKIGLFQLNGGTDTEAAYQIGSPIFDSIRIHLNERYYSGGTIEILANNNDSQNVFVESASWNDGELDKMFIPHRDLVSGGVLRLEMTSAVEK
ncbi:GH92 family glycosyl hydrolase [Pelagicoccus mobilis]|uniref:GH92 family glycosyl hydrolase n=1 Tax=Pelagicoccus mobilis TaxID=415221 RepID=A0A934VQE8_9BACT|nr:GH92 family glycosyl hydrolase [Pelagicoccus mobilis]MBK1876503.1 GH92 family glycosyl hydrolase [Pelagicoccus mobilis]